MTETLAARLAENADDSDELARAELYGLLARLWMAPPDAELLQQFAHAVTQAPQQGGVLEAPWLDLVGAMRTSSVAAAADEFDALFGGVGKPEIFVYASFYLSGSLHEEPLARLRAALQRLGLTRDPARGETEDHIAYLLEVMRYLIAGDDAAVCRLDEQQGFFRTQLQPWAEQLCATVEAHPQARVWRAVAAMTRQFLAVEAQGFDLLES